jgi:hypothetical protein
LPGIGGPEMALGSERMKASKVWAQKIEEVFLVFEIDFGGAFYSKQSGKLLARVVVKTEKRSAFKLYNLKAIDKIQIIF